MKKKIWAMAAVASLSAGLEARADDPVDFENREPREILTRSLSRALNAAGRLVPAPDGPPAPARLTSIGALTRVAVSGPDLALSPPVLVTNVQGPAAGEQAELAFSNARFTSVGERTTQINVMTGAARTVLRAEGLIDVRLVAEGQGIDQPLRFALFSFAATDLGPLFVGNALFRPVIPSGIEAPPGGVAFALPGPGRVCAMAGSPFLDPAIGLTECAQGAFTELERIDPAPLDPRTGTLHAVGVRMLHIEPFTAFGIAFHPAPVPLIELEVGSLRFAERPPADR